MIMYVLTMGYVDGSVIQTEFGVYTEAIVGLCAAINAAQIDGIFKCVKFTRKEVDPDEEI